MRIQLMFVVLATAWAPALAVGQEFAGRDKLRAHSQEFRREVITGAPFVRPTALFNGDRTSIEVAGVRMDLLPASVRAIYSYHLGWFDGNATNLFPLSTSQRAAKVPELAGGDATVLARARDALGKSEFQWAAELADYVLAGQPLHADARQLKGRALTELGERQGNAGARNYYLSAAQRLLSPPPQREERRQ